MNLMPSARLWLAWQVITGHLTYATQDYNSGTVTLTFEDTEALRERLRR